VYVLFLLFVCRPSTLGDPFWLLSVHADIPDWIRVRRTVSPRELLSLRVDDSVMDHTSKIKALLSDLGRSTKRGVKRCPSCGTYNGTRTVVCKSCGLLLKPNNKRVSPSEVNRLLTSSSSRVRHTIIHFSL